MPRKPKSTLSVVLIPDDFGRPPPPADLNAEAAAIWNDAVRSMRPGFVNPIIARLLRIFCVNTALADMAARELEKLPIGSSEYGRTSRFLRSTTSELILLATKLRLTPSANPRKPVLAYDQASTIEKKPWED